MKVVLGLGDAATLGRGDNLAAELHFNRSPETASIRCPWQITVDL